MNAMEINENIKRGRFVKNNGRILRAINVLRTAYVSLADLYLGISADVRENEYADSINYLTEIGYIKLRHKKTKQESTLADDSLSDLEAKLTADGIKFLAGKLDDDCVER
ncbi:MAG: type VI secretion protein [Ruminiclostridium sp.]|nr:type VI secretion protein [Ruminiclostridium sp.]